MVVGYGISFEMGVINFSKINEVLDCIFEGFAGIGGMANYLVKVTVEVWVNVRW